MVRPRHGKTLAVTSKIIKFELRFPTEKEQDSLLLGPDEPVYDFNRLRLLEGEPVSLEFTLMPVNPCRGLTVDI